MDEGNVTARVKSCMAAYDLVDIAKVELGINKNNALMSEEDIREVCKWIAVRAPDTKEDENGVPTLGRQGIDTLLFISLNAFPKFYEKYGLSQMN